MEFNRLFCFYSCSFDRFDYLWCPLSWNDIGMLLCFMYMLYVICYVLCVLYLYALAACLRGEEKIHNELVWMHVSSEYQNQNKTVNTPKNWRASSAKNFEGTIKSSWNTFENRFFLFDGWNVVVYYVKKKSSTMPVCEWTKTLKWIRVCSDLIWCAHSINWNASKSDTINAINTTHSLRVRRIASQQH